MNKISKKYIYKICTITEWNITLIKKIYYGNKLDLLDKYIHFSSAEQVEETLRIHFLQVTNLCLLKVSTKGLNIKWEKARNGKYFPHLYAALDIKQIYAVIKLIKNSKGSYDISSLKLK